MISALLPILRAVDAERAHGIALRALTLGLAGGRAVPDDPAIGIHALGLDFANPIGLAAGFDKNAVAVPALMRLGFGFVETGTVTPRPQPGNPRPRMVRLNQDLAVINRLGFNNDGLETYRARLARLGGRARVLGANVGVNKDGAEPERDYPAMVAAVAPLVDYIVINVSSPNTPGLRDLQTTARLDAILRAVAVAVPSRPPLLVKVAPDLSRDALIGVVETCVARAIDGLIVSNTTISRPPGLRSPNATEPGGLSGAPLRALSTMALAQAAVAAAGRLALIGCGGVSSGADAMQKILAGASLVQLYTAFAYAGPALIPRIKAELLDALRYAGFSRVIDAVGQNRDVLARAA